MKDFAITLVLVLGGVTVFGMLLDAAVAEETISRCGMQGVTCEITRTVAD